MSRRHWLTFYAKCEEIGFAKKVFDEIPEKDLVAWSTMISGYSRLGMVNAAFGLFQETKKGDIVSDEVTMVSVISACAASGALDVGRCVHAFIDKHSINADLELDTALVNMYGKRGCIEKLLEVFDVKPVKDTKALSSMIVGMAIHGLAEDALKAFSRMEEAKIKPNHATFIGILLACAHSGQVYEAQKYWSSMLESELKPSMEHYGCMIDLLRRANLVEEVCTFVETMPIFPDAAIWRTLLVGCKKNKMAEKEWVKMRLMRKHMKDEGIKAIPGCSSIEIDGFVHEFVMGNWSHPETEEIREVLRDISERVSGFGLEP
ncbi:hypothetical protein U1Q18_032276 [Sarracenia purpurea var. burkii]